MSNPANHDNQRKTADWTNDRFEYIDALRGIAILGVIVTHASSLVNTHGVLRSVLNAGGMGVQLFFVISAFTIFHMYYKHAAQESQPVRNFFIRRLFRIVPVYWYGIFFYTVIYGLNSRGWLPGPELWHYAYHLTLTNLLNVHTQSSVVPGGWSISCEVLFYLTVPLWFRWIKNLSQAYVFALVCVFILPLVTKILSKLINPVFAGTDPFLIQLYWDRFPLVSLANFSFGILLFFLLRSDIFTNFFRPKMINGLTLAAVGLSMASLVETFPRIPLHQHIYSFFFMVLALALSVRPWKFLVNPVIAFIGRISYSAYLFHFFVLRTITEIFTHYYPSILSNRPLYFIATVSLGIALTIPLAWCSYQFIERPAINFSRGLIVKLELKNKGTNKTGMLKLTG